MTDWRRILQGLYKRSAQIMGTSNPDRSTLSDYMDKLSELQHTDFDDRRLHEEGVIYRNDLASTTREEREIANALESYTGPNSKQINSLYRDPENVRGMFTEYSPRSTWENINENLLKAYMPAPYDLVVYRGLSPSSGTARRIVNSHTPIDDNDPIEYVPRFDRYSTKGHVSTSLKPSIASDWANGMNGLAYRILVPQGAPIIPALYSSGSPNEREIILRPGSDGANFYKRIDRIGDNARLIEPYLQDYKIASGVNLIEQPYKSGNLYDENQYAYDLMRHHEKQNVAQKQKKILADTLPKFNSQRAFDNYYEKTSAIKKAMVESYLKKGDYLIGSKVDMNQPLVEPYFPKNVYDYAEYEKAKSKYEANKFVNLVMSGRRGVGKSAPEIAGVAGPAIGLGALLEKYGSPPADEDDFK